MRNNRTNPIKRLARPLILLAVVSIAMVALVSLDGLVEASPPPTFDGFLDQDYIDHGTAISFGNLNDGATAVLYSLPPSYTGDDYFLAWVVTREYVDNSWDGANKIFDNNGNPTNLSSKHPSWSQLVGNPPENKDIGHTFVDLLESDGQGYRLYNDCGEDVVTVFMDLIDGYGWEEGGENPPPNDPNDSYNTPSGYGTGVNANESLTNTLVGGIQYGINGGDWTKYDFTTSTVGNLNLLGYCEQPLVDPGGTGRGDCNTHGNDPASPNSTNDLIGKYTPTIEEAKSPSWETPPGTDYIPQQTTASPNKNYTSTLSITTWEYSLIYEVRIDPSVFVTDSCSPTAGEGDGLPNFGITESTELHASPSKPFDPSLDKVFEFGDHPDTYLTTVSADGPAHSIFPDVTFDGLPDAQGGVEAIWLGPLVDVETDGQPDADQTGLADGDDGVNTDDEDGASPNSPHLWTTGSGGSIDITFNTSDATGAGSGYLMIWFDWSGTGVGSDNSFAQAGDQVYAAPVSWTSGTSTQTFTFAIPSIDKTSNLRYRVRLFDDITEVPATNPWAGGSIPGEEIDNGEIEDHIIDVDDLPAFLSYFEAAREGDDVRFEWQTVTEIGNDGFNIYVETENGRQRVNDVLVPSHDNNSREPQDYVYESSDIAGDTFYIEEVGVNSSPRLHGPFKEGETDGGRLLLKPVDWAAIRAEKAQKEALKQELAAGELQRAVLQQPNSSDRGQRDAGDPSKDRGVVLNLDLLVNEDGMYRVTHEYLKSAGYNLSNIWASELTLLHNDEPVPIQIDAQGKFGKGSSFTFYGQGVDTPYTENNVYTLVNDRTQGLRMQLDNAAAGNAQPEAYYLETVLLGDNNKYAYKPAPVADTWDIWFDTKMEAKSNPKSWDFDVTLDDYYGAAAEQATLNVGMWGRSERAGVANNHHIQVDFNSSEKVNEVVFGGWADGSFAGLPLPEVKEGSNTLRLWQIPTGAKSVVYLTDYGVTYPRAFVAQDGALTFEAKGEVFEVTNLPSNNVSVYRVVAGVPEQLSDVDVSGGSGSYSATFAGSAQTATYLVVTDGALKQPAGVRTGRQIVDIMSETADFVMISHGDFIKDLHPLVKARQAQGYEVLVVDVADVYKQYSGGVFDPTAIKDYISEIAQYQADYFLLVGGDTFNYRGFGTGESGESFIPSLYEAIGSYDDWAPVDPLYVDLDDDGVQDRYIGRFPARTSAELALMIEKTLEYQGNVTPGASGNYGNTAVFAADYGYKAYGEILASQMNGWTVNQVYLDDQPDRGLANQDLMSYIREGAALTSFIGHSSQYTWSLANNPYFFTLWDASSLDNPDTPTVVTQWGCSTTFYVDPLYQTLGTQFLGTPGGGAAAVMGASSVSRGTSEVLLGQLLMPKLTQPGMTIGEALQAAKSEMAGTVDPADHRDVLSGWLLLGDPTVEVVPQ